MYINLKVCVNVLNVCVCVCLSEFVGESVCEYVIKVHEKTNIQPTNQPSSHILFTTMTNDTVLNNDPSPGLGNHRYHRACVT